ncbi:MAG: thiol peroxidase [Acidobacteriia bacterium]|nr:thiol peroxidase [Terriglobia bacterium]
MPDERFEATTMYGNPLTLVGPELKVGDRAPDFSMRDLDLQHFTLNDTRRKIRLFSVVISLDTPVCDAQSRRFDLEAAGLGENVEVITVSCDLPFAQKRWCAGAGVKRMTVLSDYFNHSFSKSYGVLIKELQLDSRAIFVVDAQDTIRYVEYVPEIGEHPDYDKAVGTARALADLIAKSRAVGYP